jgi:hypothetical protein
MSGLNISNNGPPAVVGNTLAVSVDDPDDNAAELLSYSWLLNGVTIVGTGSTYTVTPSDVGGTLQVNVSEAEDVPADTGSFPFGVVVAPDDSPNESVPSSLAAIAGVSKAINGVQVIDDGVNSETFTVTVSDISGRLAATGAGVTGAGSNNVNISGSLTQVNASLATLTYKSVAGGTDTITVTTHDSDGSISPRLTIPVTSDDAPNESVPSSLAATVGVSNAINGVRVIDAGNSETFTVTVSDISGRLAATGAGVTGAGSNNVNISGSLTQVNAALATLTYNSNVRGFDTISVTTTDSDGSPAVTKAIAVGVSAPNNAPPVITAPTAVNVREFQSSPLSGISIADSDAVIANKTFTVTLNDANGQSQFSASGAGTITGIGTSNLTVSGTLAQVNADLSTLTDRVASTANSITIVAQDNLGGIASQTIAETIATTALNDFIGNGISDVLLQNGGTVVDWLMRNGQYLSGNILTTGASGWSVVGTGDFTGSGVSDVLLQNAGTVVDWIMQNGHYQLGNVLTTGAAGWQVVGTGDFTGIGTSDVLLQSGGSVVDWIMQNGHYQSGNVLTTAAAGWQVVGTGDFTGTGTSDVLLQNGDTVVDWIMQNGHYQSGNVLTTGAAGWQVVGTGDFTGTGTSDVLLQNGGTIVDWIMQNGHYQSGNVLTTAAAGWTVVGTGDYNGDGTSDILLQNGGTVVDWTMKNGAFQSGNVIANGAAGFHVVKT